MPTPYLKKRGLLVIILISLLAALAAFSLSVDTAVAPPGGTLPSATARALATATPAQPLLFDGASSIRFAQAQCDLGPRPPGTPANAQTADYIIKNLPAGWKVEE